MSHPPFCLVAFLLHNVVDSSKVLSQVSNLEIVGETETWMSTKGKEKGTMHSLCKQIAISAAFWGCIGFVGSGSVFAGVDTNGLFELEGNAIEEAAPGDDWEVLASGGGTSSAFTGILNDAGLLSIFDGGKKDTQDIDRWSWRAGGGGGFPDKNDITNSYSASYTDANGDLIIYFGADRFTNEGSAELGFWFFEGNVASQPDGSFTGVHSENDILILANFGGNGTLESIAAYQWDPSQKDNLRLLSGNAGQCGDGGGDYDVCAVSNLAESESPWEYVGKGEVGDGPFPIVTFFEGGINVSKLLGSAPGETPCFTSFMATTRSSDSLSATLKDFVDGELDVCSIDGAISCLTGSITSDESAFEFTYDFDIVNDGAGTLYDVTYTVYEVNGNPDGTDKVILTGTLPSPLPGNTTEMVGPESFESSMSQPTIRLEVEAAPNTGEPKTITAGFDIPLTSQCPPPPVNPGLTVSKQCSTSIVIDQFGTPNDPSDDRVVVKVDFGGQVCNTGDIGLTNVTVVDDKAGIVASGLELAKDPDGAGSEMGECMAYSGSYFPATVNATNPTQASFTDTVDATGIANVTGQTVEAEMPASATCYLCQ